MGYGSVPRAHVTFCVYTNNNRCGVDRNVFGGGGLLLYTTRPLLTLYARAGGRRIRAPRRSNSRIFTFLYFTSVSNYIIIIIIIVIIMHARRRRRVFSFSVLIAHLFIFHTPHNENRLLPASPHVYCCSDKPIVLLYILCVRRGKKTH